ncbi:hypothetical protein C8T65DRAFT_703866, partial [Cerioporus squamosus]
MSLEQKPTDPTKGTFHQYRKANRVWRAEDELSQDTVDRSLQCRWLIVPQFEEEKAYQNPQLYISPNGEFGEDCRRTVCVPRAYADHVRCVIRAVHMYQAFVTTLSWRELLKLAGKNQDLEADLSAMYSGLRLVAVAAQRVMVEGVEAPLRKAGCATVEARYSDLEKIPLPVMIQFLHELLKTEGALSPQFLDMQPEGAGFTEGWWFRDPIEELKEQMAASPDDFGPDSFAGALWGVGFSDVAKDQSNTLKATDGGVWDDLLIAFRATVNGQIIEELQNHTELSEWTKTMAQ